MAFPLFKQHVQWLFSLTPTCNLTGHVEPSSVVPFLPPHEPTCRVRKQTFLSHAKASSQPCPMRHVPYEAHRSQRYFVFTHEAKLFSLLTSTGFPHTRPRHLLFRALHGLDGWPPTLQTRQWSYHLGNHTGVRLVILELQQRR